jgi:transposase
VGESTRRRPSKALPKPEPIADRFHLVKHLRERLKEVMDRQQSCLPEGEEQASDAIPAQAQGIKDKSLHESAEPQGEPEPEKHDRTIPPFP